MTVGAAVTLDTTLELGELAETVSVVAAPERINTRTPEVATAIDQRQLATLPTLTRNPYDFIALAGNVSLDDQVPAMRGAQGFAINGQRATSVNVLLDGAGNNDEFAASIGLPVPLDAVQEYGIISANFSAQFGRATGGIVNVITKAGSNEFHGSGDYFYRNESMSTRMVDEQSRGLLRSPYSRHQPAFSVGGPIRKNRAQFFVAGEYIRVRSAKTDIAWVPSSEFLARSAAASQAYFAAFPRAGTPNGVVLTSDEIQSTTGSALRSLPASMPLLEQIQYQVPADAGAGSPQNTLALVGRIDWVMGASTSVYVRYAVRHQDLLAGTKPAQPLPGLQLGLVGDDHNLLLSLTRVWAFNLTSQSKVAFSRLANDQPLGGQGVVPGFYR